MVTPAEPTERAGETPVGDQRTLGHPEALLPRAILDPGLPAARNPHKLALRVDSISDFMAVHGINAEPEGEPLSGFRRIVACREQDTWFEVDLSGGFRADVHGTAASEKDAVSLRDAVRGMVGLGRLNVPEKQEDLLRVWDGITVEQQGRSIRVRADIAQDLIDRMVQLLGTGRNGQRVL